MILLDNVTNFNVAKFLTTTAKLSPRRGSDLADFCFVMFTFFGDNFAAIGQEPIEIFRKS